MGPKDYSLVDNGSDVGIANGHGGRVISRLPWPRAMFSNPTRVISSISVVAILVCIYALVAFLGPPREGVILSITIGDGKIVEENPFLGNCRSSSPPAAAAANLSLQVDDEFSVCVFMSIGDDTHYPNDKALPFDRLYRLFDAAKVEILRIKEEARVNSRTPPTCVKLLVGVDYANPACLMARDSLDDAGADFEGVSLTCLSTWDLQNALDDNSKVKAYSCGTAVVGRSSKFVTQLTFDWAQLLRWDDLRVIDLDEPDPSHSPPALPRNTWRITLSTAFSSNHLALGLLLLRSMGKAGRDAAAAGLYNISIIAFTLEDFNSTLQGIVNCVVRELEEDYNVPTEIRRWDFTEHPSWMRINQTRGYGGGFGEYAWKVIMIHSVVVERGFLLWADAGSRFNTEGLIESLNNTVIHGFANRQTVGFIPEYVHPGMLKYFRYMVHYDQPRVKNCDGSGIGLTLDMYDSIVRPWYDCAITRQCIAPDGSHHGNHRQDQAALTLLADMSGNPCQGISKYMHRHEDNRPNDLYGTVPSKCYADPLIVEESP